MAVKRKRKKLAKEKSAPVRKSPDWEQYGLRASLAELKTKLRIDKYSLDTEVEEQAELYGEVADAAAQARSLVDKLYDQLKELDAELDIEIRKWAEANDERITENAIKARILGDERRKNLIALQTITREEQYRLEAMASAFRQRSYMLGHVVDLYLSTYFSSRSVSRAQHDQRDIEVDQIASRLSERYGRRSKRGRRKNTTDD